MTILFVCTGNTCRSPLAVAAWRALQSRGEVPADWSAFSAGLAPSSGEAASRHAVEIARGWGVDLSQHRARSVDAGALRQVDVCVAVSPSHARALREMLRSLGGAPRVLCLSDFLRRSPEEESVARLLGAARAVSLEIDDPYGGSREAYESCAGLISESVSRLARHLREASGGSGGTGTSHASASPRDEPPPPEIAPDSI